MAFTFEITQISRLAQAHVGILDGKLLEGAIATGTIVHLVHGDQRLPLRVKGVVLDAAGRGDGALSVTVDLREQAMQLASVGDRLTAVEH